MKKLVALMLSALTALGLAASLAATTSVSVKTPTTKAELVEAERSIESAKKQLHKDYYTYKKMTHTEYETQKAQLEIQEIDLEEIELELSAEAALKLLGVKSDKNLTELVKLEKQLLELERQEEELKVQYRTGKITRSEYKKQLRALEKSEDELEDQAERYEKALKKLLRAATDNRVDDLDDLFENDRYDDWYDDDDR